MGTGHLFVILLTTIYCFLITTNFSSTLLKNLSEIRYYMYPKTYGKPDEKNNNLQDLGDTTFLKIHSYIVLTFHCPHF